MDLHRNDVLGNLAVLFARSVSLALALVADTIVAAIMALLAMQGARSWSGRPGRNCDRQAGARR